MKQRSLMRRLGVPSALTLLISSLAFAFFSLRASRETRAVAESAARLQQAQVRVQELNSLFADLNLRMLSYRYAPEEATAVDIGRLSEKVRTSLELTKEEFITRRGRELLAQLDEAVWGADLTRRDYIEAVRSKDDRARKKALAKWSIRSGVLTAALADLNNYKATNLAIELDTFEARQVSLGNLALGLLPILAAIILLFSYYIYRTVVRPLLHMAQAAERIGEGEAGVLVPEYQRHDEIGTLAGAMNRMTAKLTSANADLREAIQVRDNFMSVASHELRTPLTSMNLHVQLLQRAATGNLSEPEFRKKVARASELISRQSERMNLLISDLLDVTRIRSGKMSYRFQLMDLSELAKRVLDDHQRDFERAACHVETSLESGLSGYWDPLRIEQVVVNLITNAMKYAPGSMIRIETGRAGDRAILQVRDLGPGIPKDAQARIFDRFERAQGRSRADGLGLGLFIVKSIVGGHGGQVSVESEFGQGTSFTVSLPLQERSGSAT